MLDLRVNVGEVADEPLAHFRLALDLLDDPLLVQRQYVVFQYQFVGEALVLDCAVAPVEFYYLALRSGIWRMTIEMLLVDARRWIDVRASPVLLELLGLKGSFFGFHGSLVILSNYSNLRRLLT